MNALTDDLLLSSENDRNTESENELSYVPIPEQLILCYLSSGRVSEMSEKHCHGMQTS